jgi:hypothetical protein
MDPLTGALITGGANLIGSLFSSDTSAQNTQANIAAQQQMQAQTQSFNAGQAQIARDYNTQMSSTAYQRSSADMKAAGLNPSMMFGSGGPASVPSSPSASVSSPNMALSQRTSPLGNLGDAVKNSVSTAVNMKTMDELTAKIAQLQADKGVREAEKAFTEGPRTGLTQAETALTAARQKTEEQMPRLRSVEADIKQLEKPEAEVKASSARAVQALPRVVTDTASQGSWLGDKASSLISGARHIVNMFKPWSW